MIPRGSGMHVWWASASFYTCAVKSFSRIKFCWRYQESSCASVFDLFLFSILKKKAFEVVVGCLYM